MGAGKQSTTLALLAAEGELPRLDVAIFADTGWEPPAVYAHLDRLEPVLVDAGIEVLRVQHGDLRADALDPAHRFVSMPLYTLAPPGTKPARIPCSGCGKRVECKDGCDGPGSADHATDRVPLTYQDRCGISRRQCTGEYKIKPIRREIRKRLGYPTGHIPRGLYAENWIGFDANEVYRINDDKQPKYFRPRYPLQDLGWSRTDCERFLRLRGWKVQKSACIGCAFHGNEMWREMRDHRPAEWADAVVFDKAIRHGGPRRHKMPAGMLCFLHASRMPLDEAPIDRVTTHEWARRQTNVLDAIKDLEVGLEVGAPDGCSPYGCRSGELVGTPNQGGGL